ncbi:MAG: hypothetical protein E7651_07900 [Ruminococcaceae bacterium]|nr:hypothetical protein [Oscillospiraceae bacterium]MBQ8324010.1 hypothetical protein [Clostridia bacterium]
MKNIWKKYWPLCSLGILVLAGGLVFLLFALRSTPEKAVEGYIRASLEYDVDGLLDHASEYQLTSLMGNGEIDMETLRKSLTVAYEQAAEYREEGDIDFYSEEPIYVAHGSDQYNELLDRYGVRGTPEDVEEMAIVAGVYYVDGVLTDDYRVVAVKCGGTWYYGFIE